MRVRSSLISLSTTTTLKYRALSDNELTAVVPFFRSRHYRFPALLDSIAATVGAMQLSRTYRTELVSLLSSLRSVVS